MTLPNKMPHDYLSGRDGGGTLQRLRVQFVSSAGASAMAALLLTPLDVIKTRMQTSLNCGGAVAQDSKGVCSYFPKYNGVGRECLRIPLEEQLCYLCCKPLTPAGVPRSDTVKWRQRPLSTTSALCIAHCKRSNRLVNVVKEIVQYEGVKALWRGTGPSLFMAIPSVGIYLTSYDHAKVYLQEQRFSLATASVIAGAGARGLAATITAPLELVRTRLQADGGMRGHGVHAECERAARRATGWLTIATKAMVEKGGIRALWQGLGPTLWRDVPFSALYWLVAERTKEYLLVGCGFACLLLRWW